mgnify:CR=1 FL=1|jgi:hypothetical protein
MNYIFLIVNILMIYCLLGRIEGLVKKYYSYKFVIFLSYVATFISVVKLGKKMLIASLREDINMYEIVGNISIEALIYILIVPQCICLLIAFYYKFRNMNEVKNEK